MLGREYGMSRGVLRWSYRPFVGLVVKEWIIVIFNRKREKRYFREVDTQIIFVETQMAKLQHNTYKHWCLISNTHCAKRMEHDEPSTY